MNCSDDLALVSGYSNDVALSSVMTGQSVSTFRGLHTDHINVLKFAHHSMHIFATSSFDGSMKLWDLRTNGPDTARPVATMRSSQSIVMCCFSPDDRLLMSSAIDNEVRLV